MICDQLDEIYRTVPILSTVERMTNDHTSYRQLKAELQTMGVYLLKEEFPIRKIYTFLVAQDMPCTMGPKNRNSTERFEDKVGPNIIPNDHDTQWYQPYIWRIQGAGSRPPGRIEYYPYRVNKYRACPV